MRRGPAALPRPDDACSFLPNYALSLFNGHGGGYDAGRSELLGAFFS